MAKLARKADYAKQGKFAAIASALRTWKELNIQEMDFLTKVIVTEQQVNSVSPSYAYPSEIIGSPGDESFPEGQQKLKLHLIRERNAAVVKLAKSKFLKDNGRLYCEICNFDFGKTYGAHGASYIEAHHVKPVASLQPGDTTSIEDLKMVCANCHRILHKGPRLLSIDELRQVISAYSQSTAVVGK